MRSTKLVILVAVLLVVGGSATNTYAMPCDEECLIVFGCFFMYSGSTVLNYYHRCDVTHLDCGGYDPANPDCQKWCQWDMLTCCDFDGSEFPCRHIVAYGEACYTQ
jgi:hypothetical protein